MSPCIAVCRLDPRTRLCIGCGRSIDEIAAWPDLDDTARQRILARLRGLRRDDGSSGGGLR
ncbi:MAG: DUF1289 domain-containing protein [Rhodospirillales bacterium]